MRTKPARRSIKRENTRPASPALRAQTAAPTATADQQGGRAHLAGVCHGGDRVPGFLHAVRTGTPVPISGEDGLKVLETIESLEKCAC